MSTSNYGKLTYQSGTSCYVNLFGRVFMLFTILYVLLCCLCSRHVSIIMVCSDFVRCGSHMTSGFQNHGVV